MVDFATEKQYQGFRLRKWHSDVLWWTFPIFMTTLGFLYETPQMWFRSLYEFFVVLALALMVSSTIWEFISPYLATPSFERIQNQKTLSPLYLEEIRDSLLCMYVVATISAWPIAMYRDGKTIAFKKSVEECAFFDTGSYAYYMIKIFFTAIFSDTWTFWKHYCFHHPSVYAIHKEHHKFHDPSTYAGFAIHPIEAFATFCPIFAMCIPFINLYAPIHLPFIGWFYALNLYLHCGYTIPILEKVLGMFYINTSVWHNKHHQLRVTHFGEMSIMWDLYMGTHTGHWTQQ